MPSTLKDVDKGMAKLLLAPNAFGGKTLAVGIFDDHELAEIGEAHEFGTRDIPARPFLRGMFDANLTQISKRIGNLAVVALKGKDIRSELEVMGRWMVKRTKRYIHNEGPNVWPPLEPETIARKGFNAPLIDTGRLRASIDYRVEP